MGALPTGTVSLLFSDVECSTALLARLGSAYAAVLTGQREVLRAAWAEHGGTELGTEGDSFFVVFRTAPDAVAAAVAAQRGMAARQWPMDVPVRVRMGVHTGSPLPVADGYVGMDVHRAARIAAAAHGGQVLVSAATAALVADALPAGVGLRDLGAHTLKDIPRPERLFQLTGVAGTDRFGPVRTLGSATNLPNWGTDLIGRDEQLGQLADLIGSGIRLVTLTGPGGSGKTRLAVALGHRLRDRFPDGVFFVPLAAVTSGGPMWTSMARAVGLPDGGATAARFVEHVANLRVLLVLDNLEQLSGADAVVAELLEKTPDPVCLATSRRALGIRFEHARPVPPLQLPDGSTPPERSAAVQLFVAEARRRRGSFALTAANTADVVAVCRRLDGLPLAIELAAARTRLLTPGALLARLDGALDVRVDEVDRPGRQQTLRRAIGWSYDLLTADRQRLFRLFGVFAGGADLDGVGSVAAAAGVTGDVLDLVADLVDASLLATASSAEENLRVGQLETIRAFARDRLAAAGELDIASRAHAGHYRGQVRTLHQLAYADRSTVQQRYEADVDNIRAALSWALAEPGEPADEEQLRLGVGLCADTGYFWKGSAYIAEGRSWLTRAVEAAAGRDWPELAECHIWLGFMVVDFDGVAAERHARTAVEVLDRAGQPAKIPGALVLRAAVHWERGDLPEARAALTEALDLARSVRRDTPELRSQYVGVLGDLGLLSMDEGDNEEALRLLTETADEAGRLGNAYALVAAQQNAAGVLRLMGRDGEAAALMRDVIGGALELNLPGHLVTVGEDYAAILTGLGELARAVELFAAAEALRDRSGLPRAPTQSRELAVPIAATRAGLSGADWDAADARGRGASLESLLRAEIGST